MLSSKYISKITIALMSVVLLLCVLAMAFSDKLFWLTNNDGYSMEYQDVLFDTSEIIKVDISMEEEDWNEMLKNPTQEVYYECDVVINDTTFYKVGIRPKGNTSLSSIANDPDNNRYSFKLEFDHFVDGQTCFGLDKLILNNNYADTTNMKEAIVYDMFQYLDADASLYNYAKISVNNEYWGVYLALEAVEDSFMLRNYGTEKGYLYKPDSMNQDKDNDKDNDKDKGNDNRGGAPAPDRNDNRQGDRQGENGGNQNREQSNRQKPENQNEFKPPERNRGEENQGDNNISAQNAEDNVPRNQNNQSENEKRNDREGDFGRHGGGAPGGGAAQGGNGANLNYTDDNLNSYSTIWDCQITDSQESDHRRVVEALKNISERNNIEKYIDVEQILKYMAVHNFSVNDDSLSGSMAHNYYLYEADGQISILPWDYNLALGGMNGGSGSDIVNEPIDDSYSSTELFDFILENEEYKARYHEYYSKLIEEYVYGGKFEETYQRIRTQIDELVKTDPNAMYSYEEYTKGTEVLYEVIMLRGESIKGQLDGTIPSTADGQREDSSSLIDASHISISDMGEFMGGGGGGPQMPDRNNQPPQDQSALPEEEIDSQRKE